MDPNVAGWVPPLFVSIAAAIIFAVVLWSRRGLNLSPRSILSEAGSRADAVPDSGLLDPGFTETVAQSERPRPAVADAVIDRSLYGLSPGRRQAGPGVTPDVFAGGRAAINLDPRGRLSVSDVVGSVQAEKPLGSGSERDTGR